MYNRNGHCWRRTAANHPWFVRYKNNELESSENAHPSAKTVSCLLIY